MRQLMLPVNMGGFGLSLLDNLFPINFSACFAYAVQWIVEDSACPPLHLPMFKEVQAALDFFYSGLPPSATQSMTKIIPQNLSQLLVALKDGGISPQEKLQHQLTAVIYTCRLDALLQLPSVTARDKTRLSAISSKYAAVWLTTIPSSTTDFRLNDLEMEIQVRYWLGIPPVNEPLNRCPVCHMDIAEDSWHKLSCTSGPSFRYCVNRRHNMIRDRIHRLNQGFGVHNSKEPNIYMPSLSASKGARPNSCVHLTRDITVDYEIIHTNSNSYQQYSGQPGRAMEEAAKAKSKLHSEKSREISCQFIPFIVSTYGELHPQAVVFLQEVGRFAENMAIDECSAPNLSVSEEYFQRAIRDVIFSIIRGNVGVMLAHGSGLCSISR